MDSQTKTTLASETILALAQALFGNSIKIEAILPLTAGYFNTAYAIHFANLKPDVVLRIAPHPDQPVLTYEKDLMRREGLILETIQQMDDIPYVPKLLGADFSRRLIERDYMFIEKLSGVALHDCKEKISPENLQEIEYQVGQYVAQLGLVKGPSFGYPGHGPGHDSTSWRIAFVEMIEAILHDGQSLEAPLPVTYTELRELVYQRAEALEEIQEPGFVHWDLWAGNIFVKLHNGKYVLEGIIDWERALWGDPDIETAVACRFYGPTFFDGYGKRLARSGPAAIRQSLYRLYLWAILLIEIKVRHYEPDYLPWAREQLQKDVDFLRSDA